METLNQRRISDVSFVIDEELNVSEGNRSFLKLFNITDPHLNLKKYMADSDGENLKCFLKNFNKEETDESGFESNPYFIANIFPNRRKLDDSNILYKSCLFHVEWSKEKGAFLIEVKELSYSKRLLDKALLESREYTALLQNFDAYYFVYDGEEFILKNTKDATIIFKGKTEEFKTYFTNNFSIAMTLRDSKLQFYSMIEDCMNFTANKVYKFLQNDKKLVTVHTIKTSTRNKSSIIGSITKGEERGLVQNVYSETKDGLTDLYNKKAITELAIQKVNDAKNPVTLIIMDVDKFKECNDTYGHAFGDKVLVVVSTCIKEAINGIGIAGRIGGDEFLIILDKTNEEDIRNVTRNIRVGIQWSITAENPESVVTCSMGIARAPLNADNYDDLFKIADKCLYIAKDKGRNCYIIYKPELHSAIVVNTKKNSSAQTTSEYFMESANTEIDIIKALESLKTTKLGEKERAEKIEDVLGKLCKYIQVNQIFIYSRKNQDRIFKMAFRMTNKATSQKAKIISEDVRKSYFDLPIYSDKSYMKYFQNGFLHLDNTNVLDTLDKTLYEMYLCANVASTLEIYKDDVLICYDILKPARTFKKEKIVFATMAAKMLQELF